jgi:hypothetical protein
VAVKVQVGIDCASPSRLAEFWAEALGYVPREPPPGFATWPDALRAWGIPEDEWGDDGAWLVDPDGVEPSLFLQKVPEPKTVKNRFHLDLLVGGGRTLPLAERRRRVDAEVERLVAAGATVTARVEEPGVDHYFVAMRDPEGNEFDVV